MNDLIIKRLIKLAKKAQKNGDVPVGALIVKNNKIISEGYNVRHKNNDVLGHAEIIAIKKAQKKEKNWRLYNCDLYVTLLPCKMCENIIYESRIKNVYYLVENTEQKKRFSQTKIEKLRDNNDNNSILYSQLLSDFFESKR